jgi:hypothetical protein
MGNAWPQANTTFYSPLHKYERTNSRFYPRLSFWGQCIRPRQQGDARYGEELKEALTEPGKWRMNMYAFGECLPYADNRVTLDTK